MNESASQADMAWQGADRKVEAMEPVVCFARGRQQVRGTVSGCLLWKGRKKEESERVREKN